MKTYIVMITTGTDTVIAFDITDRDYHTSLCSKHFTKLSVVSAKNKAEAISKVYVKHEELLSY